MCSLLLMSEPVISHLKHVGVIPCSGARDFWTGRIPTEVVLDGRPDSFNVLSASPGVASFRAPFNCVFHPPIAYGVENGSSSFIQCISHGWIPDDCGDIMIEAVVVLQVVDTP